MPVTLIVQSKKWKVTLISHRTYKCAHLSAEWSLLARDNCLSENDTCAFELYNVNFYLIKVTIFKNNQYHS